MTELEKELQDILFKAAGGISDMAQEEIAAVKAVFSKHAAPAKKFRFKMKYYYKDVTGYYFDTGDRTPIEVDANTEAEARQTIAEILPKNNGRADFRLHATMVSVTQL